MRGAAAGEGPDFASLIRIAEATQPQ